MKREQWKEEKRKEYMRKYWTSPKGRFAQHRQRARKEGYEFKLTFDEWWSYWEPHWEERGRGGMQMCRTNDEGAYEVGNIRIDTHRNNALEYYNKVS